MQEGQKLENFTQYIDAFSSLQIAVIGDIMLDRYVRGDTTRISPEAPVPVLTYKSEQCMLGGAGNVARNLVSLGVTVSLFGSVGKDARGEEVVALAKEDGIDCEGVVATDIAPTTYKERIVSRGQHVVRVDHELEQIVPTYTPDSLQKLLSAIEQFDAVIVSDYRKGVLSEKIISQLMEAVKEKKVKIIVDTKPDCMRLYESATLMTPNEQEVIQATGENDPEKAAHALSRELKSSVLLTRGPKGIFLVTDTNTCSYDARVREVVDVSGAGDTVCAVASAMLGVGSSLEEMAYVSNIAGSLVVCKPGTASISRSELLKALTKRVPSSTKMHSLETVDDRIETERGDDQKIVLTNGCFDILHRGHIEYLEEARQQGDYLVVAVNSDASIKRLKGEKRPINELEHRMAVLAALSCVDAVVSFEEDTATEVVKVVKPDVYVKGGDYTVDDILVSPEGKIINEYGGSIYLTKELGGHSTTDIISKVIETHSELTT